MNEKPKWLEKLVNLPDVNANIKLFGGHKQYVPYGWIAERETHFVFEVMFILEGKQQTVFEGRTYIFSTGDIVLIPPGNSHENSCVSEEGMEYFCAHFDIDDPMVQQSLLMYCSILLQPDNPEYRTIQEILTSYVNLLDYSKFTIKEKLMVERLLIELVMGLLEYAEQEQIKVEHSDNTSLVLAKSIADTIQLNFRAFTERPTDENRLLLSIDYVADSLNISKSTMLKVFKKVYSISPKKYLDQLKYNEAKFLLHQPKLSVGEIAEVIGYQNASHFSRQFKQWSHYSPIDYRKNKENEH
ncbi:hypothetical protein IGI37_000509 [Enterococcus sp. AZ194]|uniref:helix-turn-helix domain-containing protein n=1 Tax=Enterococcus sp. AZ194 TaxID=2774629 RepID=UPI003F297A77